MGTILITVFTIFLSVQISNAQWQQCSGITDGASSFTVCGKNIFAGTSGKGIFMSTDDGIKWTQLAGSNKASSNVWALATSGETIFAGTDNGLLISSNNGINWSNDNISKRVDVTSLAVIGNYVYTGTRVSDNGLNKVRIFKINGTWLVEVNYEYNKAQDLAWAITGNEDFVYAGPDLVSTDKGITWSQTASTEHGILSLALIGANLFAGTWDAGVFKSTDKGANWSQSSLNKYKITSLAFTRNNIIAGTDSNGIFLSTNDGESWVEKNEGFPSNISIRCLCIYDNYLLAGTNRSAIWRRSLEDILK